MPSKTQTSPAAQRGATSPLELEEFARRLDAAMRAKGWSQSQLAHFAFGDQEDYRGITVPKKRDQVSAYVHGKRLPSEQNLKLMCKALGLKPSDLIPERAKALIDRNKPPFQTVTETDGRIRIRLDEAYDPKAAAKLIALILECSPGEHVLRG